MFKGKSDVAGFSFVYFDFPILTPGFQTREVRLELKRGKDRVFVS